MAFRASNIIPATQYDKAKATVIQIKRLVVDRSATFTSGATASEVFSLIDNLSALAKRLDQVKQTPGIAAYATIQEDDATYDVVAEFNTMIAAVDAVITDVVAVLPKDSNGWLLVNKINPDGSLVPRNFTGAQLANIRALLDAVAAAII